MKLQSWARDWASSDQGFLNSNLVWISNKSNPVCQCYWSFGNKLVHLGLSKVLKQHKYLVMKSCMVEEKSLKWHLDSAWPLYYLKIVSRYLIYEILFKFSLNFRWMHIWNHWSIYELYLCTMIAYDIFVLIANMKS